MVQKEIKNKARIYGIIGVLSAIVLVAMIYSYGAAPQALSPMPSAMPSSSPSTQSPETLPVSNNAPSSMLNFASYQELNSFVAKSNNNNPTGNWERPASVPSAIPSTAPAPAHVTITGNGFSASSQDATKSVGQYSVTNIQVAGVDEADTVKTDGTYLYTIVNGTAVYVMNAGVNNPQNAQVLSRITYNNSYISGIYLSQDGSKLAVMGNRYVYRTYTPEDKASSPSLIAPPYWSSGTTFVEVYDISNKAIPALARNFTMSGNYFNSRMIGNYIYAIITENVYVTGDGTVNLPTVFGKETSNIAPTSISYIKAPDSSYTYTSIISLNILDNAQAPANATIMMGGASQMYVSKENAYIVAPTWTEQNQYSNIYRIGIDQSSMAVQAKGSVIGAPINQYAMDEYNGYFRIATTTWFQDNATTSDGAVFKVSRQLNSIYVLDSSLNVVGKLEKFKMDENLYSVRFMGTKCYVVTFKQVDPFFVIDMSNPAAPQVAGQLKIPGYSSYLYPMDETHIIGLGKENSTLKLSLFDVTNVNAPTEVAKYIVDASYSDSTALYDPHAFLFDVQRQLLVIPVSVNGMQVIPLNPATDSKGVTSSSISNNWQGAYIFKVNAANGFALQGKVTQIDSSQAQNSDYYWMTSNLWINRALYIGNTLYTFSNGRVQLNSLNDFTLLAKIDLK